MGRYIYGVIDHGEAERFPLEGVVRFEEDPAPDGAEQEQAYTVSWRDVSAVVTEAPPVDYPALPKDALARLLVRHQQVIEKVMAKHTIVPLRLGTCVASDEQVRQILASGAATIRETLQKARGVVEIDVTACLAKLDSLLGDLAQLPQVAAFKQSLLNKPGGATVEDRVRIGMFVKQLAEREKQRMAERISAALVCLAEESKTHDLMDDKMVLNSAFLIHRDRQEAFDRQIEELNTQSHDRLDFRCVGPLPPYSFYTLEVKITDLEEVSWARRQLGLYDNSLTAEAIKQAHRRVARTCHPDKNPGVPGIEKKFADMSRAYQILLDYYRTSGSPAHEKMPGAGPVPEKNAILVTMMP